jgi:hypothetical protein
LHDSNDTPGLKKGARLTLLLLLIPFGLISCACCGALAPLDFAINILLGWVLYLGRVLPEVHANWSSVTFALVCVAAFMIGLQTFLSWFTRQGQPAGTVANTEWKTWRAIWTLQIMGIVLLIFVMGIAAVGVSHQTAWLVNSPERMTEGGIRDAANQASSQNNLKQLGIGAHDYHDAHHKLPMGALFASDGTALHGWHTVLLPYFEQDALYRSIDLKKPWNHPVNLPKMQTDIKLFRNPSILTLRDENELALSHYASNVRVLGGTKTLSLGWIAARDGLSNTLLAGEVNSKFKPWGHPIGWRDPALGINSHPDGFGSPIKGEREGAQFVYADGSVRFISAKVSREVLKALSTPDGGEKIPANAVGY